MGTKRCVLPRKKFLTVSSYLGGSAAKTSASLRAPTLGRGVVRDSRSHGWRGVRVSRDSCASCLRRAFAELLHEFVGSHAAEHGGEGDEEDLAEMVEGVATVARVIDGSEDFEAYRKALGIVGFVGGSRHSGNLKAQDTAYRSVSSRAGGISLMEEPWRPGCEFGLALYDSRCCIRNAPHDSSSPAFGSRESASLRAWRMRSPSVPGGSRMAKASASSTKVGSSSKVSACCGLLD